MVPGWGVGSRKEDSGSTPNTARKIEFIANEGEKVEVGG